MPNRTETIDLPKEKKLIEFDLPEEFHTSNVLVENRNAINGVALQQLFLGLNDPSGSGEVLYYNPFAPNEQRIIDIAQSHGALGWKVNGAGGEGGSLTLLCNENSSAKRALINEIESDNSLYKHIPT